MYICALSELGNLSSVKQLDTIDFTNDRKTFPELTHLPLALAFHSNAPLNL